MGARAWIRAAALRLASLAWCGCLLGAHGDEVVARVGEERVTVRDVETRLSALPEYQRQALAKTEPELARTLLERVLLPELLFAAEAERRGLAATPAGRSRVDAVLGEALLEKLEEDSAAEHPVTPEQVKAYYDRNHARFHTPTALRIWRILVADEKLARQIIEAARGVDGPAKWSELARAHSKDRATAMRKGDLGFVRPDGKTDVPRVEVDPKLYQAAELVHDGELVPDPIDEGKHLAVVWRRGTREGLERSLEEVRPWIATTLQRANRERATSRLVAELRSRHVKDLDPGALAGLDALPMREVRELPPPVGSTRPAARTPTPTPSDRGLR
jgi:hypothetical protein